jgi:hypothetical protein
VIRRPAILLIAFVLALAVAGCGTREAPSGAARQEPANSFDLVGPIEAASESGLTIGGVAVDLGPGTRISGTPAVGASARARGQIRDDGTLLAEQIDVEPALPTTQPAPPPTAAPAAPTAAPAMPTAAPAPPPTAAPAAPTAAPAPASPVARLRQLLEAARADGRAGGEGDALLKKLDEAERALAKGDAKKAGDQLRDLFQRLGDKARDGKLDAAFAAEAQALIAEIGAAYGVRAVPDEERGGNGRGNDDDDDGGDD